jgi:predicted P-loop ATPase
MVATGGKSLHVYWALAQPLDPTRWKELQTRLIAHCNGDTACKNPSRVMRLPGCPYFNKQTGKITGQCKVYDASGLITTADEIDDCLIRFAPLGDLFNSVAKPSTSHTPRPIEEIRAAARHIPRRAGGQGTYESDRNALCGCSAALREAGAASPDDEALSLLGNLWPTRQAARQVLDSTTTRNAASFWAIAKENGFSLSRSQPPAVQISSQPPANAKRNSTPESPSGRPSRLETHSVMERLEEGELGQLRLNVRSGDVHAGEKILSGNDIGRLYLRLSSAAEKWPKETTADAVVEIASQNDFDPVEQYLTSNTTAPLPMEQWERLDHHLLGIDDPIAAAFLPRYLVSAVARVFEPGASVRQVPVLVGPQWRGKSALGRILFGTGHWVEGVGDLGKDDLLKAHTAWGVELAELDGVTRRSDQEKLKAFLTERTDTYRKPYDRAPERHDRRFVFWGTSNAAPLRDTTGSTRFVSIPIPDRMLPLDWAEQNRDAIWARAVEQYQSGVQWDLCSEEERELIAARNEDFTEHDPWFEVVRSHLERRRITKALPVQIPELLEAIGVPAERQSNREAKRVRQIAEGLGWTYSRRRIENERIQGLWPQNSSGHTAGHTWPHLGHTSGHTALTSDCNGFTSLATPATPKQEKLKKVQEHSKEHTQDSRKKESFEFGVAGVAGVATPVAAMDLRCGQENLRCGQVWPQDESAPLPLSPAQLPFDLEDGDELA